MDHMLSLYFRANGEKMACGEGKRTLEHIFITQYDFQTITRGAIVARDPAECTFDTVQLLKLAKLNCCSAWHSSS